MGHTSAIWEQQRSKELPAPKRQRTMNDQISGKPLTVDSTAIGNPNALSEIMLLVVGSHAETVQKCATSSPIAAWMLQNGWSKPEICINTNPFDSCAYDHCSEVNRHIGCTSC